MNIKGYYSALAKLMNILRETGAIKVVRDIWCELFGAEAAMECVGRVPPRCVSTRWTSVDDCEEYLLNNPEQARYVRSNDSQNERSRL